VCDVDFALSEFSVRPYLFDFTVAGSFSFCFDLCFCRFWSALCFPLTPFSSARCFSFVDLVPLLASQPPRPDLPSRFGTAVLVSGLVFSRSRIARPGWLPARAPVRASQRRHTPLLFVHQDASLICSTAEPTRFARH
jgi:hypothetical protein